MVLNFGNSFFTTPDELKITEPSSAFYVRHANAGEGTETAYTVPAGKTFYISKILFWQDDDITVKGDVFLNGVIIYVYYGNQTFPNGVDFPSPLKCVAGDVIAYHPPYSGDAIILIGWLG
jgi:hypothetical protein